MNNSPGEQKSADKLFMYTLMVFKLNDRRDFNHEMSDARKLWKLNNNNNNYPSEDVVLIKQYEILARRK